MVSACNLTSVYSGTQARVVVYFQMEKVMQTLLTKFQPNFQTHFYILTTLSDLATANPMGVVPYLTGILGTMLANIKSIKTDQLKFAYANAFSR